ncbi:MAG TPA: hypothetical protein H9914_07010 [Candidatus Blautia avicola]|uniref:Uncharacterized protein n=1 Tax=Candidatus Blautia avicola TaxID=2838483 RepID=A0A9D2TXI6_9FIRM|nr:hypothetical protein [Candidatus Blautia avicola]
MKKLICSVLIDSNLIKEEDVLILNKLNSDIHFEATGVSGWLSRAEVLVLIDLAKNLEYDAAYRTLKYVLMESVSLIAGKRKRKKTVTITVICDGRRFLMEEENPLKEKRMDQLTDEAARALLCGRDGRN